jgi:archaellin
MRPIYHHRRNETGASAIGPMLIFIAVILVSTVAAGLVLSTGFDIASQSKQTSGQVQDYASSKFDIIGIILVDVELDQDIEEMYINVKIAAGSEYLNLEKSSITITTDSGICELEYTSSLTGEDATHFNCERASSDSGGSGETGEIFDPNEEFSLESPMMDEEVKVQLHIDLETALGDEVLPDTMLNIEVSTGVSSPAFVKVTVPPVIESQLMHVK